jgi:hypothetical protein
MSIESPALCPPRAHAKEWITATYGFYPNTIESLASFTATHGETTALLIFGRAAYYMPIDYIGTRANAGVVTR